MSVVDPSIKGTNTLLDADSPGGIWRSGVDEARCFIENCHLDEISLIPIRLRSTNELQYCCRDHYEAIKKVMQSQAIGTGAMFWRPPTEAEQADDDDHATIQNPSSS
jgi:hypothetical protein